MAVAELDEPGSLGRVLAGRLRRAAAHRRGRRRLARGARGASAINAGLYALPAPEIFDYLRQIWHRQRPGRALPDRRRDRAAADDRPVLLAGPLADPSEALGVNTRAELARVHRLLIDRHLREPDGLRA